MSDKREPYVLENEQGTMGEVDYLYLFLTRDAAQRYADRHPDQKWKPRPVTALGLTGMKP